MKERITPALTPQRRSYALSQKRKMTTLSQLNLKHQNACQVMKIKRYIFLDIAQTVIHVRIQVRVSTSRNSCLFRTTHLVLLMQIIFQINAVLTTISCAHDGKT